MARSCKVALLLLALTVPLSSRASEEPSLEATLEWLSGQFPQYVQYDIDGQRYERESAIESLADCQLAVADSGAVRLRSERGKVQGAFGRPPAAVRMEVGLKDLDPGHIQIEPLGSDAWFLLIPTGKGALAVKVAQPPGAKESRTKAIWMVVGDRNLSDRVSKGLAHAIRLCGGVADPF